MLEKIIRWTFFFQHLLYSRFRQLTPQVIETLVQLTVGHLFGFYNPNQLADALQIPKASVYRHLKGFSCYQWKRLLLVVGCSTAVSEIKQIQAMSDSTQSRRCLTISVDDTVLSRFGKLLSYCYSWWSRKYDKSIASQNILAITLKIGQIVIPLNVRLVGKQGRGNTEKPDLFVSMMTDVLAYFEAEGIDLTKYPITFDSWYGSRDLVKILTEFRFSKILVHAKSNYVFEIDNLRAKLSVHKKEVTLEENQWGCDKPVLRVVGQSPTFGNVLLLFFKDGGKIRTMMVFGRKLRACEILNIWSQHHGIEQFWRNLKSLVKLKAMSLHGRSGAYGSLGVKVMAYLLLLSVSQATQATFHQIQLFFLGQRELFLEIIEHFHHATANDP